MALFRQGRGTLRRGERAPCCDAESTAPAPYGRVEVRLSAPLVREVCNAWSAPLGALECA